MSWNYRVVLFDESVGKSEKPLYGIAEVYYNSHNQITDISTLETLMPVDEDGANLYHIVKMMLAAFDKPVIIESKLKFSPSDTEKTEEADND